MQRGVDGIAVTVVGDRTSGDAVELVRSWPAIAAPLVALHDTIPNRDEHRRMHGKVIVADRTQALIGSANFSVGGRHGNIELGVRIEGLIAQELCRTVEQLHTEGWLCPVRV
ncbi:MAG: phospholipase D-like domain-containing protein [Polyangiales bacterium]